MPDILSKLLVFFLFCLLIIVIIFQSYQNQDELAYQIAKQAVTDFGDNVRMKGYISPGMIEDFETELEVGSYQYNIEFHHEKKVYTPIYTDPTNPATFTGDYMVDYDEYYQDEIKEYLFTEPGSVSKDDRKYLMTMGDFFYVNIENRNKTKATMLFEFLTNSNSGDGVKIAFPYGGMILNEDF